jgi:hypothetical protein
MLSRRDALLALAAAAASPAILRAQRREGDKPYLLSGRIGSAPTLSPCMAIIAAGCRS